MGIDNIPELLSNPTSYRPQTKPYPTLLSVRLAPFQPVLGPQGLLQYIACLHVDWEGSSR